MKILQIILCILSCLCLAASILIGIYLGWEWFAVAFAAAALLGAGMLLVKKKSDPVERMTDFMNTPDENAEIKKQNGDFKEKTDSRK